MSCRVFVLSMSCRFACVEPENAFCPSVEYHICCMLRRPFDSRVGKALLLPLAGLLLSCPCIKICYTCIWYRICCHGRVWICKVAWIYDKNRSMKNRTWADHYTRRARKENWLARSVYKLSEIDSRFRLIRKGNRVLDIGCFPGSWSQYGIRQAGRQGEVIGIDIQTPEQVFAPNFTFIQADMMSVDPEWLYGNIGPVDVVISDLAPKTTGHAATDAARSMQLAKKAAETAFLLLKKRGRFLCKIFEGDNDLNKLKTDVSAHFCKARLARPKATRKRSREIYLVALDFRG